MMWNQILKDAARAAQARGELPEPTPDLLQKIWPSIVGPALAHMTSPLIWEEETLSIALRHSGLLEEWRRRPAPLLAKINEIFPWNVKRLLLIYDQEAGVPVHIPENFSVDPSPAPAPPPDAADPLELPDGIDSELRGIIDSISSLRRKERS